MTVKMLCYGFWAECPEKCSIYEPVKNQEKCFVWQICKKNWTESGGRLGLSDLIENMNKN